MVIEFKPRSLLVFTTILLFLCCSGSQIGIDYARYFDIVFVVISAFLLAVSPTNKLNKNLFVAMVFVFLFLLNYLIWMGDNANLNSYISYTCRLLGAYFICSAVRICEFKLHYVRILSVLSLISLIVYTQFLIGTGSFVYLSNNFYVAYGIFRVSNVNGLIRNSCMFWEPGAYQLFLNLAIFFILDDSKFDLHECSKKSYVTLIVFAISLVTTASTTGYILGVILAIVAFAKTMKNSSVVKKILLGIPMSMVAIYGVYYVAISEVVMGKFTGTNTNSAAIRLNDVVGSLKIIVSNPLIGLGFGTNTFNLEMSKYGIGNNAAGLLLSTIYCGLIFALLYVARIIIFTRNNRINYRSVFLILVFAVGFTENFYLYPIYFIMLFEFNDLNIIDNEVLEGESWRKISYDINS